MKRKRVGYFEGTDPVVLSNLICDGHDTIPISNGLDNHGLYIRLINEESKVDVMVGYLHKIYSLEGYDTQPEDIFHICQTYQIRLLVIVPNGLQECARKKFSLCPEVVEFVDPDHLLGTVQDFLNAKTAD